MNLNQHYIFHVLQWDTAQLFFSYHYHYLFSSLEYHDCPFKDLNPGKRIYFTKNPQVQGGAQSRWVTMQRVMRFIYQLRKCRGHNNRRCSFTQSYKYTAVLKYYKKPKYNDKKEAMLYKHTYDDVHISAPQVPWSQQPTQQCCFAILQKKQYRYKYNSLIHVSAPQVLLHCNWFFDNTIIQMHK